MSQKKPGARALWFLLPLFLAMAAGCGLRPTDAPLRLEPEATASVSPSPSPAPTVQYVLEFRDGEALLSRQSLPEGALPEIPAPEGRRLLGWVDARGESVTPGEIPVSEDAVYYALTRPVLAEDAVFLFADAYGRLRPADPFTRSDAALAAAALCPSEGGSFFPAPAEDSAREPLSRGEFLELLNALFDPESTQALMDAALPTQGEELTRAMAANVIAGLLGPIQVPEGAYYPDAGEAVWARDALLRAAGPSSLSPEDLRSRTKDGFLWIEGWLYALDEEGYFITGDYYFDPEESAGLLFDENGRFTSGEPALDRYVAETLAEYVQPDRERLEDLRAVYYHVKDDFQYLTRNYYDSGATGWENQEALTLFETGKGNCYCYAAVFRSLARGLGYNAVCYSGSMGSQNQPHAWTEITMEDGRIYICDPEIEMNYWWLAELNHDPTMYTDNFMVPREKSGMWNYQAQGRKVHYE